MFLINISSFSCTVLKVEVIMFLADVASHQDIMSHVSEGHDPF
jgi:hypothetical protein